MADLTAPPEPGSTVDLTNCDREPIHTPGSIQPHATLLVLREPGLIIRQASANVPQTLGVPLEKLLGAPLSQFLAASDLATIQRCLVEKSLEATPHLLPSMRVGQSRDAFECSLHRCMGVLILELESWNDRTGVPDHELLSSVRGMLSLSQSGESVADFCQRTTEAIRQFTGFDRVMVYRFDPDLSGHVIAEAKREDLESYLELHYPASDIPKQARELLRLSKLRLVPDVNYTPVPLVAASSADSVQLLDMSFCVTRSMSPIHVEYLQNMGVRASMSISVVIDHKLWGLFACHHCSPRYVSHAARSACDFMAHALSILVAGREQSEDFTYNQVLNENQRLLNRAISNEHDFGTAVRDMDGNSIGGIHADGAALVISGVVSLKGRTPGEAAVLNLARIFWENVAEDVWYTDRLGEAMPAAATLAAGMCGILAARLSRDHQGYLFWFREEVPHTVKWAGELAKNVVASPDGDRLSPRKSFELWRQEVRGRSKFWLVNEITAAKVIRQSYLELYATQTQSLVLLNADLAQKLDRAEATLQAKDNFLATLSHELRTPLNPALLLASEEAENEDLTSEVRAHFTTIREHIELEVRLIDDLLDLSRIQHGKVSLARKPLSLHAALRQALAILNSEFTNKPVTLVLRLAATEPVVNADILRLLQVFWNVLKNAVKFTPENGTVTVESGIDTARNMAVVRISDTGIGMNAEELPRIFEAFSQGDHAGKAGVKRFGGLGLGLAITRALLAAHEGRIAVESAGLNQGSTFIIELPIDSAGNSEAPPPPVRKLKSLTPFQSTTELGATARKRILLIEDHAPTRAGMSLILQRRGYEVREAASIKAALTLASAEEFSLVISDIGLPDGDGYSLMRELRTIRPGIKAIALSGYGMETDRQRAHDAGFAELLLKPINIQTLEMSMEEVLSRP